MSSLSSGRGLQIRLEGYEGPLDVLLDLARAQKVDLLQISIAELAEQYLAFVQRAEARQWTLAADYLVMAAWLTWLKSRLLLPQDDELEEGDGDAEADADAMRRRLWHLQKIREAAHALMARPQLGRDVFAPGSARGERVQLRPAWRAELSGLLAAYAQVLARRRKQAWRRPPEELVSVEAMRAHLKRQLPQLTRWTSLQDFWLGKEARNGRFAARTPRWQMALSGGYAAALESAHDAELELRQARLDAPLFMRRRAAARARRTPRQTR